MLKQKKHANFSFIIGNTTYHKLSDLPNAERDARHIAQYLDELGFNVSLNVNVDYHEIQSAFTEFLQRLRQTKTVETVFFYFAGHGFQEKDENFLLPITKKDREFGVLSLQKMIDDLAEASQRRLIFLDACRSYLDTDIVEKALMRSRNVTDDMHPHIAGGFGDFGANKDTFISFSASPGKPAYDGLPGQALSPYAQALGRFIKEVDLPLTVMMARVRNSVAHDTQGKQQAWDSSSLTSAYFFNPSPVLFLFGNLLALFVSIIALLSGLVVFYEAAVSHHQAGVSKWGWVTIAGIVLSISVTIFLSGIARAYGRIRGATSQWQNKLKFKLFSLSSYWKKWGYWWIFGCCLGIAIDCCAILA